MLTHAPHALNETIEVRTDADGVFVIPNLAQDVFDFVVMAEGFAPEYREIKVRQGLEPLEVRLQPGAVLRVRLVDEAGLPVPDATLGLAQWGPHEHKIKWSALSGPDGCVEWTSAPSPEKYLELYAMKPDWCFARNIRPTPGGEEHVVTMRRALEIFGQVTDAVSGQSVAEVRAFPGYGGGVNHWARADTRRRDDGTYRVVLDEDQRPWGLRIEAAGYVPFVMDEIPSHHAGRLDVALEPLDSRVAVHGVVLRPDGSPAPDASVVLLMPEQKDRQVTVTHADGRFEFPPNPHARSVAAASIDGFACQALEGGTRPFTLQLQDWGRVEVTVAATLVRSCRLSSLVGSAGEDSLSALRVKQLMSRPPYLRDGQFRFLQLPPGTFLLQFRSTLEEPPHHQTLISVAPGVTTTVHVEDVEPEFL